LGINSFTLTHLSPPSENIVSQRPLKGKKRESILIARYDRRYALMEHCKNPWHRECKDGNIEVYILFRGERLPICRRCWTRLADKDVEW
jgi:hypothetical protein